MNYNSQKEMIRGTKHDPRQIKIRKKFKTKFLKKLNERKNSKDKSIDILKKSDVTRNDFLIEYKLKYGSIENVKQLSNNLEIPLSISEIYIDLEINESQLCHNSKDLFPMGWADNLCVQIDPLILSMPIFIHEMTHYLAFNDFIPQKTYNSLITYGKKVCDNYKNDPMFIEYYKTTNLNEKNKIQNYTLIEHEYAAIAAETWSFNDNVYEKLSTDNNYNIDNLLNDLCRIGN